MKTANLLYLPKYYLILGRTIFFLSCLNNDQKIKIKKIKFTCFFFIYLIYWMSIYKLGFFFANLRTKFTRILQGNNQTDKLIIWKVLSLYME